MVTGFDILAQMEAAIVTDFIGFAWILTISVLLCSALNAGLTVVARRANTVASWVMVAFANSALLIVAGVCAESLSRSAERLLAL